MSRVPLDQQVLLVLQAKRERAERLVLQVLLAQRVLRGRRAMTLT